MSAHTRACAHAHDCYLPVAASVALAPDELRGLLASGTEVPGPAWTHPPAAAVRASVCGPPLGRGLGVGGGLLSQSPDEGHLSERLRSPKQFA